MKYPSPGTLADDSRIYAIGDIHGCLEKLRALHAVIAGDLASRPIPRSWLVHLGDYVDRGPESAGVIAMLRGAPQPPVSECHALMGNHEVLMLNASRGEPEALALWLGNGGGATLASYGVPETEYVRPALWRDTVGADDLAWIARREITLRCGSYVFVHAGVRPGRPLGAQTPSDLLWIREPFLSDPEPRDFVVVHGHTPSEEPEIRPNRIGIDTGAAMGGRLTCAVLERNTVAFLQA